MGKGVPSWARAHEGGSRAPRLARHTVPRLQAPHPLRTRPQRYARSHAHSLTAAQDAPDADTARTTELQSLKRLVEDIYEGDVCGGFREFRLMSRAGPWCRALVQGRGAGPWWRAGPWWAPRAGWPAWGQPGARSGAEGRLRRANPPKPVPPCSRRRYCSEEPAWAGAVEMLDQKDGAGWGLLQQMVDCRKGELAGSVTARGLLESCKWFE